MSNKLNSVLGVRDEGLHATTVFEYLNTISIFLDFSASLFNLKKVERNDQKDIIGSVFELYPQYQKSYLSKYPGVDFIEVSEVVLLIELDQEHETLKALLEVTKKSGELTTIEVT